MGEGTGEEDVNISDWGRGLELVASGIVVMGVV